MRVSEDGVWRYYNCPDPHWSAKCRTCREKVSITKAPVPECVDCWKVEIWRPWRPDLTAVVDSLIMQGLPAVAKASRAPILVVRTGIPSEAYPDQMMSYLLMFYAERIAERDLLLRYAVGALNELEATRPVLSLTGVSASGRLGLAFHRRLPVRRGCWRFDDVLGPWQTWYPIDRDWQESARSG